jgi:hypothetical protein
VLVLVIVNDGVFVGVLLLVPEPVTVLVTVLVAVLVTVGVRVGVIGGEILLVGDCEDVQEGVPVPLQLTVVELERVPVNEPLLVTVPEPLFVIVPLGLAPIEPVLDIVDIDVGVWLIVVVPLRVGVLEDVLDIVFVTEGVPVWDIVFAAVFDAVDELEDV